MTFTFLLTSIDSLSSHFFVIASGGWGWGKPHPQLILGPPRRCLRQGQHDDLFPRRAVAIADGQFDGLLEARVAVAEFTRALLHDARRLVGVSVRQVDDGIAVMEWLAG